MITHILKDYDDFELRHLQNPYTCVLYMHMGYAMYYANIKKQSYRFTAILFSYPLYTDWFVVISHYVNSKAHVLSENYLYFILSVFVCGFFYHCFNQNAEKSQLMIKNVMPSEC